MTILDSKVKELRGNLGLDVETGKMLGEIEMNVLTKYTLADAIREGSTVTEHCKTGWGTGETACALSAAVLAAQARGFI